MTALHAVLFPQYLTTINNFNLPNYAITENSKKDIYKLNFRLLRSKIFIPDLEK